MEDVVEMTEGDPVYLLHPSGVLGPLPRAQIDALVGLAFLAEVEPHRYVVTALGYRFLRWAEAQGAP